MVTPNVSSLIARAFAMASAKNPGLSAVWIRISFRLGGMLPNSMLVASIQQDGNLDALLRAMEDERRAATSNQEDHLLEFNYQVMLSELWVGRFYEHLRLLVERGLLPDTEEVKALAEDFRLLRVPIEKHEITSQGQLTGPLQLHRRPAQGNPSDTYVYDKADTQRAHIMPRSVSQRGSLMWQAVDLKNSENKWIERRQLSDRILAIWGAETPSEQSG